MKNLTKIVRKISITLAFFVVLYLGIGLAFHMKWKSELATCREIRRAQGEFVEPEVFGGILGLVFDVTNWPIYSWANIYHDGTLFATPCTHPETEKDDIRNVVWEFGRKLQTVSLLSPNVAQEMEEHYSDIVSSDLLEQWENDTSMAPGRMTSSPWPDHIEIKDISKNGLNKYLVTGFVVEVTSMEKVNGGAATQIPVQIVVQKNQGDWLIAEYTEER